MENKLTERCCLGKFLGEDCDKTTYCRNIGRLDISNFDEKIIDLMQQRSLYNFKASDTICFYNEKVYHTCYEALQLYCFDCIKYIRKKLSKVSYSRISHCTNIKNETRGKIVCELYEIISRKVKL